MEFSNINPNNLSLAEIREEAYKQGREDAMQFIIDKGNELHRTGMLTDGQAFGICVMMGIAKAEAEQMKGETDEAD